MKKKLLRILGTTLALVMSIQMSSAALAAEDKDASARKTIDKTPFLETFSQIDQEVGYSEFWNSINPDEVKNLLIDDNGNVTIDDANITENDKKDAEAKKAKFEEKFNKYIEKINTYNKKLGLDKKAISTDGNGHPAIGSITGDGDGTNNFSTSGFWKGDVMLLDDPGVEWQGAITHGGIYDGTSMDYCIYSAENNEKGVTWESITQWRKHDSAYGIWVGYFSSTKCAEAYDKAKSVADFGEPYVWYSSKSDTSQWYCTKIPWYGYKNASTATDIDFDGGYWCMPIDIFNDGDCYLQAFFD